jgi:CHRD domain-containing protein
MKRRVVVPALVLAGALVATVGASARPQATSIQIRTVLNAAQEVPAPTGAVSNAGGTFSATVTKSDTGASVSWQLSFNGLTGDAIAAHIHTGAIGSPGPVVLALCGPCSSPASGTGTVPEAVVDAIQAGTAYVNVHTVSNKGGEIRGQLATTATVATRLTSRQEVPKPKGNVKRATGSFTATIAKLGETDGQGDRRAHSHRSRRASRSCRGRPVRSVPERAAGHGGPDACDAGCAAGGAWLRERPHPEERRGGDPGAAPRGSAHDLVS